MGHAQDDCDIGSADVVGIQPTFSVGKRLQVHRTGQCLSGMMRRRNSRRSLDMRCSR